MQFLRFLTSKLFLINLIAALVIAVALLFFVLNWIDEYTLHQKEIILPNVTHQSVEDAQAILQSLKLNAEIWDSSYSSKLEAGIVLAQIPKAGAEVKQDRTIYLTINATEPPKVKMPDLIDKSIKQALIELENRGLKVGNLSYVPDIAFNAVIKQKINGEDIKAGDLIMQGAKIDLVLGEGIGNTSTQVPFLISLNLETAKEKLMQSALNLGSTIYIGKIKDTSATVVVRQIPEYQEGNELRLGQSVDIFLAQELPDSLQYLLNYDNENLNSE